MLPLLIAGEDRGRGPLARGGAARGRGTGGRGCRTGRRRSRAASSSAWRWRGRWRRTRWWSWPTSPRATSTRPTATGCTSSSVGCRGSSRRRWWSSPTIASLAARADRVLSLEDGRLVPLARRGVDALMSCDQCQEREAVIHLTQIVNEQVTTLHLCEKCAAEKGVESPGSVAKTPLGSFLAADGQGAARAAPGHARRDLPALRGDAAGFPGERAARLLRVLPLLRGAAARPAAPAARLDPPRGRAVRRRRARAGAGRAASEDHGRRCGSSSALAVETENFELAAELRDRSRGCWNDRPEPAAPTAGWAGWTPAAPPATSCSPPGSGWRGTSRDACSRAATRETEREEILTTVERAAAGVACCSARPTKFRLDRLDRTDRQLLHERHLVSKELAGLDGRRAGALGRLRCWSRTGSGSW